MLMAAWDETTGRDLPDDHLLTDAELARCARADVAAPRTPVPTPAPALPPAPELPHEPVAIPVPRPAVRTQQFALKPMFVDEAVLQLDMTEGQQFLVFRNAGDGKVNVLYRRKVGDFGLIEPAEV